MFYAWLLNIVGCSYKLDRPINEKIYIEKIIVSLSHQIHAKVIVLESIYKLGELTVNEPVGDLQAFKLHHLLPRLE